MNVILAVVMVMRMVIQFLPPNLYHFALGSTFVLL
jgi:hypothetical protein